MGALSVWSTRDLRLRLEQFGEEDVRSATGLGGLARFRGTAIEAFDQARARDQVLAQGAAREEIDGRDAAVRARRERASAEVKAVDKALAGVPPADG